MLIDLSISSFHKYIKLLISKTSTFFSVKNLCLYENKYNNCNHITIKKNKLFKYFDFEKQTNKKNCERSTTI